jgi:hypothetical protein
MMTGTSGRDAFAFGKSSSPLIPGILMSDRIRIKGTGITDFLKGAISRLSKVHGKAAGADVAPELLAKQVFDVGFIINNEYTRIHV